MEKSTKIFILILAVIIVGGGFWVMNGFIGNPISKMIAEKNAKEYIAENYAHLDLVIDEVFYDLKDGYYHVRVLSEESIDTHFTVLVRSNTVVSDSFEDDVLSGWNTYERIDQEYRQMVENIFSAKDFPLVSEIDFGMIEFQETISPNGEGAQYGVSLSELERDKVYDVKELAETAGHITYYAQDEDVSFERASELLLILKESLDQADIPFYAIDFVLEKPREGDGAVSLDSPSIHTENFLYEDIYEDGLVNRLEQAHKLLMDEYEAEDRENDH